MIVSKIALEAHDHSTARVGRCRGYFGHRQAGAAASAQRLMFLGDAGGLPTLNAAGILPPDKP